MLSLVRILCLVLSLLSVGTLRAQQGQSELVNSSNTVNWSHPLNRGLVSWYVALPAQQRGVIFRDLCGRNHGTLTGMDPATDWVGPRGRPGGFGALDFDGSNDQIRIANSTDLASTVFSVSFWMRCTTNSKYFIGWYNTATSAGWAIKTSSGGAIQFETASSGFGTITSSDTTWTDGNWHHGVLTCAGSSAAQTFYTNGSAGGSGTLALNTGTDVRCLGSGAPNVFYFPGQLDDFRFYNRALSAGEVWQLYTESRMGYPGCLNRYDPPIWYDVPDVPSDGFIFPQVITSSLESPAPIRWKDGFAIAP